MTEQIDLYAVLGLSCDATQAEISRAYRNLVRRYHPDTRTAGDQAHGAAADEALQQVLTAYAVLCDPRRRAAYDKLHATRSSTPSIRGRPVSVSWIGRIDEPVRFGPVRWDPWPSRPR